MLRAEKPGFAAEHLQETIKTFTVSASIEGMQIRTTTAP